MIKSLSVKTDISRRLQTMPGVGPLTALAIEAFAPSMESFKYGRDFAAGPWGCSTATFFRG